MTVTTNKNYRTTAVKIYLALERSPSAVTSTNTKSVLFFKRTQLLKLKIKPSVELIDPFSVLN